MGHSGMFAYMRGASSESAKPKVTRQLLIRVLAYARPYFYQIIALLATILITTGLGLLTPLIFRDMIDKALPNHDTDRLNILALALVMIPVASGIIRVVQRWLNATVGEGVIFDLRVALFDHLQKMSLSFFTNTKTGELMSRLNNDVVDAQRAISNTIVEIITNGITVVATLTVMLTLEWRLTLLGVAVLPAFIILMRRVGTTLRDIARETMQYNAQMNAMMHETLNISGSLLVKLFGRRVIEVDRFEDRATKVRDMGVRRAVIGAQFFVLMGLVSAIGTALVYWVGGHLYLDGTFTIGTIVAFGAFLTQLYGPLQALTNAPVEFATSLVSFERVFEIIDLTLEIDDKPDAIELQDIDGQLTFDNISFRYELNEEHLLTDVKRYNRDDSVMATISGDDNKSESNGNGETQAREDALENINFTIEPGQLAALVGPSGAGKTTLTYLIPRLYDPTEGHVLIDGYDLRDVTLESLAQQIGMVTQETYLFHDTVRTNLLYAKLDANQQEIEAACKAANIHDFIMGLSDGYNTIVGERGYRLSGGEKQRLALARVILKDPRILVLDEATSSLDSQSESLIQDALKKVLKGRTSIVIAHRLSTILAADMILVMNRGRIVEHGTHDELLAEGGLYAGLYETQFSAQHEMA
jgi:ATP-binding cassette, subfamily B, bacterial